MRPLLLAAFAAPVALALLGSCGRGVERPNVILVAVDTLRADRLATYGHPRPTSPWLDALAARGTVFEDATAQSGWTLPSMVSLFTGHYLTSYAEAVPPAAVTLPEVFRQAGYRTVGVVANLSVNHLAGFDRGFDVYDLRAEEPRPGDTGDRPRTADRLAADLEGALDAAERLPDADERPLFLFFFPYDPHDPYYPQPRLDDVLPPLESDSPVEWQREVLEDHPATPPEIDPDWEKHLAHIAKQRGFYDQEVRHTDEVLAEVFEELERRGLLEDSVVAFVSDHGEGLWEHVAERAPEDLATLTPLELFYQKHGAHLYEEAIATPFVLHGRGVPEGARIRTPVENVDLFPTLLALAGVPAPPGLHGVDLTPHLAGAPPPERGHVHSFVFHRISVREIDSGLKLILPSGIDAGADWPPELFHLPSDPDERRDLSGERPEDVARLEAAASAWRERFALPDSWKVRAEGEQLEILRALGYTDEDIGEREHGHDEPSR